jgi:TP901 family phage tail tape measure protein
LSFEVDRMHVAVTGEDAGFQRTMRRVQSTVRGINQTLAGIGGSLQKTGTGFDATGKRIAELGTRSQGAFGGLKRLQSGLIATAGAMAAAGKATAFLGAIAAIYKLQQAFRSTLGVAMAYEDSMNLLQAASGATDAQMKKLGDRAKALGADVSLPGTSASDAATAMLELNKAGLSITDTMDAAKGVLQLSAAANIENAEAATITANALNAFGLKGTEAARVADILAATANGSSAEITDVAYSLQQASAVAAAAGIPIEDTAAAIGLLANNGIAGSDAGTSLKTAIQRLQSPTAKAADAMRALGVDVYDAEGNMRPLPELIGQFERGLTSLPQERRDAALNTIFGSDAGRAARILFLREGAQGFADMAQTVSTSGAAGTMASARMKGLSGAIEGVKSIVETLQLVLAEPFLDPLAAGIRVVGEWLSSNQQRLSAFAIALRDRMVAGFGQLIGVIRSAWSVASPFFTGVGDFLAHMRRERDLGGFLDFFEGSAFLPVARLVASAIENVTAGFRAMRPALEPGVAFIRGAAIGVLGGLLGTLNFLSAAFRKVGEFVGWVGARLRPFLPQVENVGRVVGFVLGSQILNPLGPLVSGFVRLVGGLRRVTPAFRGVASAGIDMGVGIGQAVAGVWSIIRNGLGRLKDSLAEWGGALVGWVRPRIPMLVSALAGLARSVGGWIVGTAAPAIADRLTSWGRALVAWVPARVGDLLGALGGVVRRAGDWITRTGAPALSRQLTEWGAVLVGWVRPRAAELLRNVGGLVGRLTSWLGGTGARRLQAEATAWGGVIVGWVESRTPQLLGYLGDLLSRVQRWAGNVALPAIERNATAWGRAVVDWVGPRIGPLLQSLGRFLLRMTEWMAGTALPGIARKAAEWGGNIIGWIAPRIPGLLDNLGRFLTRALNWAEEAGRGFRKQAAEWGRLLIAWVRTDALPYIGRNLSEFGNKILTWMRDTALPGIKRHAGNWASAALNWISGEVIPGLGAKFLQLWASLKSNLGTVGSNIKEAAAGIGRGFVNALIGGLNRGIGAVESFVNKFGNAIDSVGHALNLPDLIPTVTITRIPAYATGTQYHPGGLALVGDDPRKSGTGELVNLPRGSRVYTAAQSRQMMNDTGSGQVADTVEGPGKQWPGGVIPFFFMPGFGARGAVRTAMRHITGNTGLTFSERAYDSGNLLRPGFVRIQNTSPGHFAHVGKMPQNHVNLVNLSSGFSTGIAIHELAHTAGLWHEQMRADRDRYVRILWENIRSGQEHNFKKLAGFRDHGAYDYGSTMHYSSNAFSRNGRPTILRRDGGEIPYKRSGLSALDATAIRSMYAGALPGMPNTGGGGAGPGNPIQWLFDRAWEAFGPKLDLPGVMARIGSAVVGKLKDSALTFLTGTDPTGPTPGAMTGPQVAALALRAGFKGLERIRTALAVAWAESGLNPNARNFNSNGTIDRGLWQINSIHGALSTFNPLGNAKAAYSISGGGRNWTPWVAYNNGSYRNFLDDARRALPALATSAAPSINPRMIQLHRGGSFTMPHEWQVGPGVVAHRGERVDVTPAGGQGRPAQVTQHFHGVMPGDVQRETERALRRLATDWAVA